MDLPAHRVRLPPDRKPVRRAAHRRGAGHADWRSRRRCRPRLRGRPARPTEQRRRAGQLAAMPARPGSDPEGRHRRQGARAEGRTGGAGAGARRRPLRRAAAGTPCRSRRRPGLGSAVHAPWCPPGTHRRPAPARRWPRQACAAAAAASVAPAIGRAGRAGQAAAGTASNAATASPQRRPGQGRQHPYRRGQARRAAGSGRRIGAGRQPGRRAARETAAIQVRRPGRRH